ncbi:MAG: DEAD/DEAH box helicase [Lachnospiraceae bacterium]|nr:DEAD/DEAH box helicase [Lachnospiraceae bacterium]
MKWSNIVEERLEENLESKLRFDESGIHPDILRAVHEMGFEVMTPIQEQSVPVLLEGKDIIGQAQTGTGKTAAFAIPMIQKINPEIKRPQGIILCPTRELAMQAAEEIRRLSKYMYGVKVLPVYGGQDIGKQIRALSQGVQIIVGTPGRVMDHLRRHTIKTAEVKMIVLDEADEMLDMGFREDIETVLSDMPEEHQMALFSATMPQAILEIAGTYQQNAVYIRVTPKELTVSAIKQAYYRVAKKDKIRALCRLLDYYQPARSLIFANTKRMVDEIAGRLNELGYEAGALHGDLTQAQRDTVMGQFRKGTCSILIATDVAARGIDVSGVDAVFNYDVPEDIEYYVHRIGRTGRAGRKGRSFTLISGREIFKIRSIEKVCHTTIRERQLPTVEDVIRVKSDRLFAGVMGVIENEDLSKTRKEIEIASEKYGFSALDLAAALMHMNMGETPEEIEEEQPYQERGRGERRRERGRRGRREERSGREERGSRSDRGDRRERRRREDFGGLEERRKTKSVSKEKTGKPAKSKSEKPRENKKGSDVKAFGMFRSKKK